MNKIKLVIWDLDETFWKGTLSEEGIIPIQSNIELISLIQEIKNVNLKKNRIAFLIGASIHYLKTLKRHLFKL
jgi:hypothetical protein